MGLGNLLMSDDGVGVRVAEELRKTDLPPSVEVYDAGTPGLSLINLIDGYDKAVLIDAVRLNGPPGTVYRFEFDDTLFDQNPPSSMHELDAVFALKLAKRIGKAPKKIVVIGVEPKKVELGLDLSKEVESSIPKVIEAVLREVVDDAP